MEEKSKNERAKKLIGMRKDWKNNSIPLNRPFELGYHCPICDGNLDFSEYYMFMWCPNCNIDIPSCMCKDDVEKGIEVFLDCIEKLTTHKKEDRTYDSYEDAKNNPQKHFLIGLWEHQAEDISTSAEMLGVGSKTFLRALIRYSLKMDSLRGVTWELFMEHDIDVDKLEELEDMSNEEIELWKESREKHDDYASKL